MGRRALFSKEEITEAYKKAKSFSQLAGLLHVSLPTAYHYITKYKLKSYLSLYKIDPLKIAKWYNYSVTLDDLASKFGLSRASIRYHLQKLILYPATFCLAKNKNGKSKYPPPEKLFHIKIINALVKSPSLVDSPAALPKRINLSTKQIDSYWAYAFGYKLEDYK